MNSFFRDSRAVARCSMCLVVLAAAFAWIGAICEAVEPDSARSIVLTVRFESKTRARWTTEWPESSASDSTPIRTAVTSGGKLTPEGIVASLSAATNAAKAPLTGIDISLTSMGDSKDTVIECEQLTQVTDTVRVCLDSVPIQLLVNEDSPGLRLTRQWPDDQTIAVLDFIDGSARIGLARTFEVSTALDLLKLYTPESKHDAIAGVRAIVRADTPIESLRAGLTNLGSTIREIQIVVVR